MCENVPIKDIVHLKFKLETSKEHCAITINGARSDGLLNPDNSKHGDV
jgi:hypothetical protein